MIEKLETFISAGKNESAIRISLELVFNDLPVFLDNITDTETIASAMFVFPSDVRIGFSVFGFDFSCHFRGKILLWRKPTENG